MAISLKPLSRDTPPDQLILRLQAILSDLEDQLNSKAQVYANTTGLTPNGLTNGDVLVTDLRGKITIKVKSNKQFDILTASMLGGLTANGTQFLGLIIGTTTPTSPTYFPNEGDWGFFIDTTGPTFYLVFHHGTNILFKRTLT